MKTDDTPNEIVYARSRLFELIQLPQSDGRIFEVARRAPGVRLIVANRAHKKVLLTKEFRREIRAYDWRLPGGKLFDTLVEYEDFRKSKEDILPVALEKARAEAAEEAGIEVGELSFFKKSTLGTTVEWDLFVFESYDWKQREEGQALGAGEQVDSVSWLDASSIEKMALGGEMQEERVALILLQWLRKQNWLG